MTNELILTSYTYDQGRVALNYAFSAEASFNSFSASTMFSGNTNLYDIFGGGVNYWSAGTGTNAIIVKNNGNIASGDYSLAEGFQTTASGNYSHSEGYRTTAPNNHSHSEGYNTNASGSESHTEGDTTFASGIASHAEGAGTTASGFNSHSEGNTTKAIGDYSHAEGRRTTASGDYSHSQNYYTKTASYAETAIGKYNYTGNSATEGSWIETDQLFVIGNGTGVGSENNALTVFKNGNTIVDGGFTAGTTYLSGLTVTISNL
jgi:hypothetical protein